jgi:hypothetical protein
MRLLPLLLMLPLLSLLLRVERSEEREVFKREGMR